MTPLRTGIALAITVGLFYTLCALVWALAPGPSLTLLNGLFHGMKFNSMVQPGDFSLLGFLVALVVLSAWAFLVGTFFGWLRSRLSLDPPPGLRRAL